MALSDQDMVDIRRHTGYGAFGAPGSNRSLMYYRYYPIFTMLEYRMANFSDTEIATCQTYIAQCNTLETAIWSASDNLDTRKAAVWEWNTDEVGDRMELYVLACKKLCSFLQVPVGPFFVASSGSAVVQWQK